MCFLGPEGVLCEICNLAPGFVVRGGFLQHCLSSCHGKYWEAMIIYDPLNQWLFLIPVTGGRWHIIPQLAVYTTYIYILPSGGLYATYHLLREPETTID